MYNEKFINVKLDIENNILKDFNSKNNIYCNVDFFKPIGLNLGLVIGNLSTGLGILGVAGPGPGSAIACAIASIVGKFNKKKEKPQSTEYIIYTLKKILKENLNEENFKTSLQKLIIEKGFENSEVIKRANIDKSYFYQILKGTKSPSRDRIIQIAIALELDIKETNELLMKMGFIIYGENKRDAIILHCIQNKLDLFQINDILDEFEEKPLASVA